MSEPNTATFSLTGCVPSQLPTCSRFRSVSGEAVAVAGLAASISGVGGANSPPQDDQTYRFAAPPAPVAVSPVAGTAMNTGMEVACAGACVLAVRPAAT